MYGRRLQLLLDDERYARVAEIARQRKTSVAAVVREAIDRGLPVAPRRRAAAANLILAAQPAAVGDPEELRSELDELRGRRG